MVQLIVFGNRRDGTTQEEMISHHREVHVPLGKAMNVTQSWTAYYVDHEQTLLLDQGEAACDLVVVAEFPSLEAMQAAYATTERRAALEDIPKR